MRCSYTPDGYPLPIALLHFEPPFPPSVSAFSATLSLLALYMSSSNTHSSMHTSLVTLAATLAAPTILNLESALLVTVKLIPGN